MGSIVVVVVMLGIFVAYGLFHVRGILDTRQVKRLYKQADVRMVGGPFDGFPLNYEKGGWRWPPKPSVLYYLWVEEENHYVPHRYERTEEGEYHLSKTLPPVQSHPADRPWSGGVSDFSG